MNLISVSVMPWCGSQSAGQSFGSIVNPDVPLYTPSIRPSCDAGVCWAAAPRRRAGGRASIRGRRRRRDDPAVDVLADEAVAAVDDSRGRRGRGPGGRRRLVVTAARGDDEARCRHGTEERTRHLAHGFPLGVRRRTPRRTLRLPTAVRRRGAAERWRWVVRRTPRGGWTRFAPAGGLRPVTSHRTRAAIVVEVACEQEISASRRGSCPTSWDPWPRTGRRRRRSSAGVASSSSSSRPPA